MWRTSRSPIVLLVFLFGLSARALATTKATITVAGTEQQVSGVWDTASITISFNGFTETVSPGQYATSASIASAFAAKFARDDTSNGLSAQVICGSSSSLITFALASGTYGPVSVTGSTTSFQMTPAGFQTGPISDTGTVTLTVGGVAAATTPYGASSTPSSIASGLASGVTAGSFVNVTAVNDGLYLVAKQSGLGTNYTYSITSVSTDGFSPASFGSTPSGALDGGANPDSGQPQSIYSFNGVYDGVGNLITNSDSAMGNWGYTYDSLNRLVTGTPFSGTYNGQYLCWAYDPFGNRTAESLQISACTNVQVTATFNNLNQATSASGMGAAAGYTFSAPSISYDPAGDVQDDGSNQYLYDAEGRLCAVYNYKIGGAMTGYLYGADGTRVAKGSISSMSCDPTINHFATMSDYILGPSNEQLTELDMDSNGVMAWQHTNIWAVGGLLGTYDADGTHFYLDDPLGTRRAQTDYAGVLENTCQSLPYGNSESCPPTPTEHLFTGKERDAESGLDYFGARYMGSSMGRFMSPDWSDDAEPIPYADLGDPQTLNLYTYGGNNPLSNIDPDGHLDCSGGATQDVACAVTAAAKSVWNFLTGGGSNNSQQTSVTTSQTDNIPTPAPTPAPTPGPTPSPTPILDFANKPWVTNTLSNVGNFSAGAGDFLSFGLTKKINQMDGGSAFINSNSGAYTAGKVTGIGIGVADIAATGLTAAAVREGKYGAMFGRGGRTGGGLMNVGKVRFGWYWTGTRDAIGLRILEKPNTIHIPFYFPTVP